MSATVEQGDCANGGELAGSNARPGSKWSARLLAFGLGFAAMCYVQSGSYEPSGRDSFYHTKMAVLMGSGEVVFPERFPWASTRK